MSISVFNANLEIAALKIVDFGMGKMPNGNEDHATQTSEVGAMHCMVAGLGPKAV